MEWDIKPEAGSQILTLRGSATLPHAAALKEALLAVIATTGDIVINLKDVDDFDLAGLQLLGAAHHSAAAQAKGFTLVEIQEAFHDAALCAGFNRKKACNGCSGGSPCIWIMNG